MVGLVTPFSVPFLFLAIGVVRPLRPSTLVGRSSWIPLAPRFVRSIVLSIVRSCPLTKDLDCLLSLWPVDDTSNVETDSWRTFKSNDLLNALLGMILNNFSRRRDSPAPVISEIIAKNVAAIY